MLHFHFNLFDHYPVSAGIPVQIGALTVTPFSTPHDSIDPLGFALRAQDCRACVITDIGYVSETIRERLRNTDILVIESNHDLEMLRTGPYPWTFETAGDEQLWPFIQ